MGWSSIFGFKTLKKEIDEMCDPDWITEKKKKSPPNTSTWRHTPNTSETVILNFR